MFPVRLEKQGIKMTMGEGVKICLSPNAKPKRRDRSKQNDTVFQLNFTSTNADMKLDSVTHSHQIN